MGDVRAPVTARGTTDPISDAAAMAHANGLVYVSDSDPGIRRVRKRKGFAYVNSDKRSVTDADTLARIASLAIPPAYADVWICADERGHLGDRPRCARAEAVPLSPRLAIASR